MKSIGDYEYSEKDEIGKGSYGKVYKGRHHKTELAKVVAIKVVDIESNSVTCSPNTIRRETDILNKLSGSTHRNIVTLFHFEKQAQYAYFVMEFCNGGSLEQYLLSKQRLDEHTIRMFLRQIAAGLKVAHDMNIIHRDLKPENILLCFTGRRYPSPDTITLKIADFGVGRFLSPDEMTLSFCGSPLYMAPEVFKREPYDNKVDMWSIGVIAYECLFGSLLKSSPIAFIKIEIPTNISPEFSDLLNGLLEKDQKQRFTTKQFFNHQFLATTISVSVVGSNNQSKMIHVEDNRNVDHLMDVVCDNYNTDSETAYLVHEDGRTFERGSGNSLRESDIVHNSTVTLVLRLSGGSDNDGKMVSAYSSSVSPH